MEVERDRWLLEAALDQLGDSVSQPSDFTGQLIKVFMVSVRLRLLALAGPAFFFTSSPFL